MTKPRWPVKIEKRALAPRAQREPMKAPQASRKPASVRVLGPLAREVAQALHGSPIAFPDKLR